MENKGSYDSAGLRKAFRLSELTLQEVARRAEVDVRTVNKTFEASPRIIVGNLESVAKVIGFPLDHLYTPTKEQQANG